MSIKGREIKKVGITTFVTFACVTALSTMNTNNVHASEQDSAKQAETNNVATAQSQDANKISANTQNGKTQSQGSTSTSSNTQEHKDASEILEKENEEHSIEGSTEDLQAALKKEKELQEDKGQINTTKNDSGIYKDDTRVPGEGTDNKSVGSLAQELEKYGDLGIAAGFHIFSKNTNLNADTNGNIATENLNVSGDQRIGSRNNDDKHKNGNKYNQTSGDIYYIKDATRVGSNVFGRDDGNSETEKVIVLGDDLIVEKCDNGNHYSIKNSQLNHVSMKQEIKNDSNYIDVGHELKKLTEKSNGWNKQSESESKVEKNFKDFNNQEIKILKDDKVQSNHIYVDLNFSVLHDHATPITISGISTEKNGPVIIINVKYTDSDNLKDLQVAANKVVLKYTDGKSEENSEVHTHYNHVLWNFGTQAKKITFQHQFSGSVLAPNAEINFSGGVFDGNVIGKTVNISGQETHRWDLSQPKHNQPKHYPWLFPFIYHWKHQPKNKNSQPTENTELGPIEKRELPKFEGGVVPGDAPSYDLPEFYLDQPTKPTQPEEPTKPDDNVPPAPEVPDNPAKPTEPSQPTNPNTPPNIPENFIREKRKTYTYSFAHTHGQDYKEESKKKWDKMDEEKFSYTHKTPYTRTVRDKADNLQHVVKNATKITKMTTAATKKVVSNESASKLPETGANESWMASLIGFATFALGALGLKLNKKNR